MTRLILWLSVALSCFCLPAYSQNTTNPFVGSQYSDLADLTDWYLAQGGSIDDYFYSEGFTTGSDNQLGNEYICIRDDVNKVYVGRSDVCADRQMDGDGYSYIWVDEQDWSMGFPEDIALETGDVINDSSINWSGCFNVYPTGTPIWGGESGGQCPNMYVDGSQINYGYIQQTLTNTAAINLALQEAGVEVTGYRYQWNVKNADANRETENNPNSVDPFEVTIKIYNSAGQTVFEKTYDYSYWIDNWTTFSGEEAFANPFDADTLSEVQLSVTGYDIGFWAGYYGPEFSNPEINLRYQAKAVPIDPCDDIPVVDPTCPGFIGEAPTEDAAVKELVIIESTGSIPLSEDELTVLESLEEEEEAVEEVVVEQTNQEVERDNSAALAVARNAEANALADAASTIENTLAATAEANEQTMSQLDQINQQAQEQSNQSMQQANDIQQSSIDQSNQINQSIVDTSESLQSDISLSVDLNTSSLQVENISQDIQSSIDITQQNSNQQNGNQSNDSSQNGDVSSDGSDITMFVPQSNNEQEEFAPIETIDGEILEIAALDNIISDVVMDLIKRDQAFIREQIEQSNQEEQLVEPMSNEQEDELVSAALAGDDSEEAQAALLGYNPNFRAYQQPQMQDTDFYKPKDIYAGQENYDNPNARLFNGASDATHREMVRQQYEGN